jgi:uncharacterized protein with FMN-binding domain
LLSSNVQPKAVEAKKTKGVLQGVALLGLSVTGAMLLLPHSATASTSSTSTANSAPQTATGDAINYQFGTVQLSVTSENSKITKIDLVQSSATAGREQAFSYLVTDAITANGTNFSNLSGATYTTDAFKQALQSAISKLS